MFRPVLAGNGVDEEAFSNEYLEKVVALIRERASFVHEFWGLAAYFFQAPTVFDEKAARKQWKPDTPANMRALSVVLQSLEDFSATSTEHAVKNWIQETGLSFGQVMPPLRLILVGAMKGPHLFDIMELLGKQETLSRIDFAVSTLGPAS